MTRREPLIDSDKAAVYLGMPNRKALLNQYRVLGIPFYKVGVHVRFRVSELDEWLAAHQEAYV